jgi:hypothetical protein
LQKIADYLKGLKLSDLSPLTPQQKLDEARKAFEDELAKAKTGDTKALGDITTFADAFLTQARDFYASSQAYTDIFNSVTDSLTGLQTLLPAATTGTTAAATPPPPTSAGSAFILGEPVSMPATTTTTTTTNVQPIISPVSAPTDTNVQPVTAPVATATNVQPITQTTAPVASAPTPTDSTAAPATKDATAASIMGALPADGTKLASGGDIATLLKGLLEGLGALSEQEGKTVANQTKELKQSLAAIREELS